MGLDLKKVFSTAAPWIATAIGGPMAGQAVRAISGALGLKEDAKLDDVQAAIDAGALTGDQLVKLKEADQEFQKALTLAGYDNLQKLEALAQGDRDSARKREMSVRDATPKLLAAGVTGGFFGILVFMLLKPIPSETHDVLMVMIGSLGTAWSAIIAYYFGSSAGSAAKTELLAKAPAITTTDQGK